MISLNLYYMLINPISKYSHFGDYGFNIRTLRRHNSVHKWAQLITQMKIYNQLDDREHWPWTLIKQNVVSSRTSFILFISRLLLQKGNGTQLLFFILNFFNKIFVEFVFYIFIKVPILCFWFCLLACKA